MSNHQKDQRAVDNIRVLSAAMVEKANSGHPGGAMGGADYIHILFSEFMKFDPDDTSWPFRDRFFLDPGHMSPMLYSQLYLLGNYKKEDISSFRQWGSVTPGHPEVDVARGVENTSGPLGQGHAMGAGAALAAKFLGAKFGDWMNHKIYAFISDGGIQEEISQGVGRIAGYLGLNNLIMFYDSNDVQLSTYTDEVTNEDTAKKYEAWGWNVVTIDGNDHDQIRAALKQANEETEKPFLIIGKTIMGKGCKDADGNPYEGKSELHGKPIGGTKGSYDKTIEGLGGSLEDPFVIFPDVADLYSEIIDKKRAEVKEAKAKEASWRSSNAESAAKLDMFLAGKLPDLDLASIAHKENAASRDASASVLAYMAENIENVIVASADLANSDKTDGFLKKSKQFAPGQFDANFFHAGVCEFSMAAMANGMALHGGVIPVVGTFFIFSDYQKPAYRLSALMELPVIYLWTHDAFRVGEDGPTHQPIEQEAQVRLLEQLKNHKGKRSFLALRPADSAETTVAWKMALENKETPTALILSRQGIKDIPSTGDRFVDAMGAEKGAYVVKSSEGADVTLVANGSEVSTLIAASELLEKDGISVNIVSVISEGLFRDQSESYQASVLDNSQPVFGLTAGLPVTLAQLVGQKGKVFGLDHFGYSAPAGVLDEKFGFTGEHVYDEVKSYLASL
ncbi:transketolase [Marinoscillum sp. MHG1-6]|uniref:transketolase family protein n=1 Tax=Marinoscillum sp. MHG1-6 TaxID=2959627 RepID=UPI002157E2D7|nr:transketolase [Marinoscillum sp. MHG1-6]